MSRTGVLKSEQMGAAFSLLRSRDLLWTPAVNSYLRGKRESPNDLMAWNADGTRMPCRMHAEYLRELYLNNALARGEFTAEGRRVDLAAIRLPMFVVGTETDHVAPWQSVYKARGLTRSADYTFLLTSGGHNAGIVSGPVASAAAPPRAHLDECHARRSRRPSGTTRRPRRRARGGRFGSSGSRSIPRRRGCRRRRSVRRRRAALPSPMRPASTCFRSKHTEHQHMNEVVITAALRSAVGKFNGTIGKVPAAELGAQIIKALLAAHRCPAAADLRGDHGAGAHRRRRPEPRPAGADPRRSAGQRPGNDDRQGLRQRPQGDASGRAGDQVRRCRDRHRRRSGEHERVAAHSARIPRRISHGRCQAHRQHDRRRPLGRLQQLPHGRHGRERREEIRDFASRTGRIRRRIAAESRGGAEGGSLPGRNRADRDRLAQGDDCVRCR